MFWHTFLFASAIKMFFIPAYRSTDFEVHRNWMAITHSRPLSRWYYDATSEWTLDYPPFFAYFEWALSQVAAYFDSAMLEVQNLNYSSMNTVLFQRFSVIVADLMFAFGVKRCFAKLAKSNRDFTIGTALLLCNIGLFMVDHIHFQYNGFLFGFLLLSVSYVLTENYLTSALFFAALLNLKHIFIYVAPVYVVFLLRFYCFCNGRALIKLIKLGLILGVVCLLSFGPFYKHIPQVLSRLFPFKRGLTHAYWAPNFWALYNFADKVLSIGLGRKPPTGSNTGGLVQTFNHVILPSIPPSVTFTLSALAMLPTLYKLWTLKHSPNLGQNFIRAIILCACSSFMFGWHVHEKAILMVTIPLTILAITNRTDARWTIFLSIVGHYSLFPLLFKPELVLIKHAMLVVHTGISILLYRKIHGGQFLSTLERLYLFGFVMLSLYENIIHPGFGLSQKLPFVPLMATSVYCAIGVSYFWLRYQSDFFAQTPFQEGLSKRKKT
ncbi:probable dolichyl pyrophosphate Glc1Man9GlcNAc2 alpha-1,3-glucosyltransferase [Toxorhynchites rutilus septentrionalis]|uniref:probable dolichyl pyrophosphate Glc1Man9GlcNAc2 alpha-1,3-glucosyltransferase n=1 Tax=Toxorhynchites rutilus septentrionalis TaxID=329112 RepID=UPI002478CD94|nr:probable dolichyl pyrophosphate Glc1Man9GlcNAc2 alpha-1,3-glucosyltransferase [Toxorhynchites rutilus septentrionalis]